jgi:hypothetical protein
VADIAVRARTPRDVVDGITINPSSTYWNVSRNYAVTAAGTTQGTATALTANVNVITGGAVDTGVLLATAVKPVMIRNQSGSLKRVYPQTGGSINGLSANDYIEIMDNSSITLDRDAGAWFSFV